MEKVKDRSGRKGYGQERRNDRENEITIGKNINLEKMKK